ncbi:MAG TPA: DUF6655 family protein [Alphaproteobacteria bacterium]|nr:DUF6655 family protein [Alphaproteobacteria bacterium]
MRLRRSAILLAAGLGLSSCTTPRVSNPPRTATEELLISRAADHAADRLELGLPPGTKVFLDTSYFEGTDAKYAIGDIRDRLLKQGADLVPDRKDAEAVVEARAGALSIDDTTTLYGIPSFNIPIPLSGTGLTFPEIALFKKDQRRGVAKFALTGYGAKNGAFESAAGPVYGYSYRTHYVVLLFVSWTKSDLIPKGERFEKAIERQDRDESAPTSESVSGAAPEDNMAKPGSDTKQ